MDPDSSFPRTTVPISLYLSTIGSLIGPSMDLLKFGILSKYGMNGNSVYQGQKSDCSLIFAPGQPWAGIKWMSFLGLKPTFFKKRVLSFLYILHIPLNAHFIRDHPSYYKHHQIFLPLAAFLPTLHVLLSVHLFSNPVSNLLSCRDYQYSQISLRSTTDHIGTNLMARGI